MIEELSTQEGGFRKMQHFILVQKGRMSNKNRRCVNDASQQNCFYLNINIRSNSSTARRQSSYHPSVIG